MTIDGDGVVQTVFLRTAFNYDMEAASLETALFCDDGTRTQQQFAEECDINTIVERFGLTGELPQGVKIPFQADFDQVYDYQSAMNLLIEADEAFMQYPANIRAQFQNDPEKFVSFVSDPANIDKVREWGLARAETPRQGPIDVRVIPTPSEPEKIAPTGSDAT